MAGQKLITFVAMIFILSLIVWLPQTVDAQDESSFQSGFAERDITPEIGMEQPGGYGKSFHQSIHDPCKVRAAVFSDGEQRVAIVSVDALLVHRRLVLAARERIAGATGIPAEAVLIHATHSHSSGPTGMIYPGDFDHASEFVQELAYVESSNADLEYVQHVENQIVDAVASADADRANRLCSIGSGHEDEVAYNRRFRMRTGFTFTHPRSGNPDIIEPAGPVDPEVGVIGCWDEQGGLVGCLINYSCHATTSPGGASANYIYYLEQVIRGFYGDDVVVVFLAGASGDVTQVDNLSPYVNPQREQWARIVGGSIGAEALKVLFAAEPGELVPIGYRIDTMQIPRRPPSPERLERCLELVGKTQAEVGATEWTFAKEIVLLDALLEVEPIVDVEVQAIQVGPAVFITNPAEYFVQYGLDIKEGSPFPYTFPVSLANGCVGYVPTEEAFGPRGGGYETRLTSYSNLQITAGSQIADKGIELSRQLAPGDVPTRAPAPEYRNNAWGYGAVPPEID